MDLSILICTIPERKSSFNKLYAKIINQTLNKDVEVLYNDLARGAITIGEKRNILLNESKGRYICYVDDDDDVSDDYIEQILNAIKEKPDCVGFEIECNMDGKIYLAASSIKYNWEENKYKYKYVRSIYHKTPVLRSIALKAMFPDKSFGEDYEYSMRIKSDLKKEVFINKVLYFYNYKYENPKIKYGI